jgi:bestrophin, other
MSVSYFDEIATAKHLTLLKLLFCKWKGSVLKLLWKDLLVFFSIFFLLQLIYRLALNEDQQKVFETICVHGKFYQEKTPLSFLLGFFVGNVFDLWWSQWNSVPWPITLAIYVSTNLHGFDEVGRAMRRTIMRYVCLSATMVFRTLAPRVKKRFPRMDDLIAAGLINEDELDVLQELDHRFPGYGKYWLPICWAASLATKARDEGRIRDDFALKTIVEALNHFRSNCGSLMNFAYVCE